VYVVQFVAYAGRLTEEKNRKIVVVLSFNYMQRLEAPHNDASVNTTGADLPDGAGRTRVGTDGADGVLVDSVEVSVINSLAPKIHLSEHVERRFFAMAGRTRLGGIQRSNKRPARRGAREAERFAVLSKS
jgi:hypothetical protein